MYETCLPRPADDCLEGTVKIAEFIGVSPRRAMYLLQSGSIPGGRVGRVWIASKRKLAAAYDAKTAGNSGQPRADA
jgi:hypothetical protein